MNNFNKHTNSEDAKHNVLRLLANGGTQSPSSCGYSAFPGYYFKSSQGAALASSRLMRELLDDGMVTRGDKGLGYQITEKGRGIVAMTRAVTPLFTFRHAGKRGAFYAPDMVVWGGMGFQLSAIRCPKLLAAVRAAEKGGAA